MDLMLFCSSRPWEKQKVLHMHGIETSVASDKSIDLCANMLRDINNEEVS